MRPEQLPLPRQGRGPAVLRSLLGRDTGGLTVSEVVVVLVVLVVILGAGIPLLRQQLNAAHARAAQVDVRALSIEVEGVLRELGTWDAGTVEITWDPRSKQLTIPNPGGDPDPVVRVLPLTEGTALLPAGGTWGASVNTISGRRQYCLGVESSGQVAFQDQNGPAAGCP